MAVNPVQGLREPAPSTANPLGLAGLGLDANSDGIIDTSLLPAGSDPSVMFDVTSADDAEGLIDGAPVITVKGATGRLGVGTASPSDQLTVGGASNVYAGVTMTGSGVAGGFVIEDAAQEWQLLMGTDGGLRLRDVTVGALDRITINRGANGTGFLKSGAGSSVLRWNTSGVNLGVGPATPTAGRAFQVTTTAHGSGSIYVADADGTMHFPWDGTSGSPQIALGASSEFVMYRTASTNVLQSTAGNMFIGPTNSSTLFFQSNGGNVGRFLSDGSFAVGSASPTGKFEVQTTGQAVACRVADADGTLHSPWDGSSTSPNIEIGAGTRDLALWHDGTNSVMRGGTSVPVIIQSQSATLQLEALTTGSILMRAAGATVLSVTTRGTAQLTPLASAPGSPSDGDIWITTGGDLQFHANGTTYTVTAT